MPRAASVRVDLTSADVVKRFRSAAEALTSRATKTKRAAIAILVKAGIYTKKGKLTAKYR